MPDKLLKQSAPFISNFFQKQADLLKRLAEQGQSPEGLFIGCSDSRVAPEQLLGLNPGDLFMLRNIANIIPPYQQGDTAITAVLEYAVRHLHVPHIIVCGHTDCGGIKGLDAQIDDEQESPLFRWIEFARPAQQEIDANLQLGHNDRHQAIVERNVVQQLQNIKTYPFVLKALEADQIELHGWVYYLREQLMGYYDPTTNRFDMLETVDV
jgi:carbonic anhydrase